MEIFAKRAARAGKAARYFKFRGRQTLGLDERRYAHDASGRSEPNLMILKRIRGTDTTSKLDARHHQKIEKAHGRGAD